MSTNPSTIEVNIPTQTDVLANVSDGDVEVGGDFAREEAEIQEKAAKPAKEAVEAGDDAETPEGDTAEGEETTAEETEESPKPRKKPSERIKELNARNRELERELERERIKNELRAEMGLQKPEIQGNNIPTGVAPDKNDLAKYPLGGLDDRYIEDLADWKVDQKLNSVLQRQQETAQAEAQKADAAELLKKADEVVLKGASLYEDYREVVWDAGQRGDYDMSEATFNAILEAEHGADVAYALASNPAEASRVARLSPYQQVKYVADKSAEFGAKRKSRVIPSAGEPPTATARGSSGKFSVAPDTDDLGAFAKELFRKQR